MKRGTARRLGLRPWPGNDIAIGEISTPDGERHRIVLVGSRCKPTYLDQRGSAVSGPTVDITAGMVNDHRRGPVRVGAVRIGQHPATPTGDTEEVQPVNTDDVRDWMAQADPANAGLVMSRDQVVETWCRENGKHKDTLSFDDIVAIRALPQWINAG